MSLFCLNYNLVYLLYFCPSLDRSFYVNKINKQTCGLARKEHRNAVKWIKICLFAVAQVVLHWNSNCTLLSKSRFMSMERNLQNLLNR